VKIELVVGSFLRLYSYSYLDILTSLVQPSLALGYELAETSDQIGLLISSSYGPVIALIYLMIRKVPLVHIPISIYFQQMHFYLDSAAQHHMKCHSRTNMYHADMLKLYKEVMVGLNCQNTPVETRIEFGKTLMALLPSNVTKLCTLPSAHDGAACMLRMTCYVHSHI